MRTLTLAAGVILIIIVLWDMFEAVILPRSVTRSLRMARLFYRVTWGLCTAVARVVPSPRVREALLGSYGPLSLPLLLVVWALWLIMGFALVLWGAGSQVAGAGPHPGLGADLYLSGVTFFTLGYGDITPQGSLTRVIAVGEAGVGFGFLAIVIGYLPVIYQAFSRREVGISLLDSRAGSPPTAGELLRRHAEAGQMESLAALLQEWEHWAADLLESHLSYPVLAYYHSQHDRESWLAALTAVLDTCAVIRAGFEGDPSWGRALQWQAEHTYAMSRHAAIDMALVFNTPPAMPSVERLTPEALADLHSTLRVAGAPLRRGGAAEEKLQEIRRQYEPYVGALADRFLLTLPEWVPETRSPDNWKTSAWGGEGHF